MSRIIFIFVNPRVPVVRKEGLVVGLNPSEVRNEGTLSSDSTITSSTVTSSTVVKIHYQIPRTVHRAWTLIHPRDLVGNIQFFNSFIISLRYIRFQCFFLLFCYDCWIVDCRISKASFHYFFSYLKGFCPPRCIIS